ncbi:MAG: hypothetical protein Kow00127_24200 [Bacteroidales bacterium]
MNDQVIFSVRTTDLKVGLIGLHSELGKYTVHHHPSFQIEEGAELEFFCPVCHAPLTSTVHRDLARVVMVDEENREFDILFSRRAGEKSTYKIIGESMEIYGDDSAEYIDFINLTMNF